MATPVTVQAVFALSRGGIDAIAKRHPVVLLGMESTDALFHGFAALLQLLGRLAKAPGTHDSTMYGSARASTQSFYSSTRVPRATNHTAAISAAVVTADTAVLLNTAAACHELRAHRLWLPQS